MATREYQTGEGWNAAQGNMGEFLPNELSDKYFQNLDAALARVDRTQLDRTLGGLSDRGFLRSGDTFTQVSNDVLGPSQERRNQILLPELQRAAGQGREERLGDVAYGRQKEMQAIEHKNRLEELSKQAEIRRMLMELEDSMSSDSGGFDWGALAGQGIGTIAGGAFGGVAGGISGKIGSSIWENYGKKR